MTGKKISQRSLLISAALLAGYFLFRLLDQSQMVRSFPFDAFANDWSGHIARLFFLSQYGFGLVPDWFNGYFPLQFYPPGFYMFSLPFFLVLGDILAAVYLSVVALYALAFLFVWQYRLVGFNRLQRVLFFLFVFANPVAIGYYLRLGKIPELQAWVWGLAFVALVLYYRNRPLDRYIFLLIPLGTIVIYSHILAAIVLGLAAVALSVARPFREQALLAFCGLVVLFLTMPFWYPFLTQLDTTVTAETYPLQWLILPGNVTDKVVSIVVPVLFWILGLVYMRTIHLRRQEKWFWSLLLAFSALFATRLLAFVPLLNRPTPDSYHMLFIILSSFLALKLLASDTRQARLLAKALPGFVGFGILLSVMVTPLFTPLTPPLEEALDSLADVDGRLLVLGNFPHYGPIYTYGLLHYGIQSPGGWGKEGAGVQHTRDLTEVFTAFPQRDCAALMRGLQKVDAEEVLTTRDSCEFLLACGLEEKKRGQEVCLLRRK